jgi:hypothetical protein
MEHPARHDGTPGPLATLRTHAHATSIPTFVRTLDAIVASEPLWDAAQSLDTLTDSNHTAGRPIETCAADHLVVEALRRLCGSTRRAVVILERDDTWEHLANVARQTYPADPSRRLSPTSPTRNQQSRFYGRYAEMRKHAPLPSPEEIVDVLVGVTT